MNKILFFLILLPVFALAQNTYYVDATNGNDSNNGLNTATAWQTIAKVNTHDFIAGDIILFKRNEIWYGERLSIENVLGTSTNHVRYAAYGNGEKPIISSVIPQSHNWIYTANNIWKASNPPTEHPERLLINGIERLRANILSELDGIHYYWFYDNNTNDLYLHTTEDPVNTSIAYSSDFPLIIGDSSYISIENLDFQGGWTSIFITTMSKNIYLENLTIGKYAREGIIINTDSNIAAEFPENITIANCNFDAFFAFDYASADSYPESSDRGCSDGIRTSALTNSEIQNCYFKNWGHASINIDGLRVSNVLVHNNYLSSPDICYGGRIAVDDANNVEVYNNEIINTSVQSQLNGQSCHFHHNIFAGTTNTPLVSNIIDAGIELQGYSYSEVSNNIFENNIILNTEGPAIRISGNNDYNVSNNTFRNNIIYNCGSATSGKSIIVEQNQFGTTQNNSFTNNLIYNANTTQTCEFRNNLVDVSNFNSINLDGYQMANNIADNPQLVDIANEDYHLNSSSPCINAGIVAMATLDFEGNSIPFNASATDIGIYEYQDNLSFADFNKNNSIVLFPNPVNEVLQIQGLDLHKIKSISLTDISGKMITKNIFINNTIITSHLPKGFYFIHIKTTDDTSITKKIIRQ